jgi:4-hydroxy-tetrahydrodipicolinate synthase
MTKSNCILWTAIITPFDELGKIHYGDFEKILRRQEKARNGILILGSTGESLSLSDQERREVVTFVMSLNLSTPIMVGVGGFDLKQNIEWIKFCDSFKDLFGFLMVTPIYAKPGPVGQTQWFEELLSHTTKPSMLYNIPSRSGVSLSQLTLTNLSSKKNLWAIKESSGNLNEFENFVLNNKNIEIFSGEDGLITFSCQLGAKGLVSVVSNIWPHWTKSVVEKSLKGNISVEELTLWRQAVNVLFTVTNPVPAKVISWEKNLISSPTLRMPLTDKEMEGKILSKDLMKKFDELELNLSKL